MKDIVSVNRSSIIQDYHVLPHYHLSPLTSGRDYLTLVAVGLPFTEKALIKICSIAVPRGYCNGKRKMWLAFFFHTHHYFFDYNNYLDEAIAVVGSKFMHEFKICSACAAV
jgi:hypothetical protein